jgi:hypothetical protein
MRFRFPILVVLVAAAIAAAASQAGSFLVVNEPRKSDVIVVLAGETNARPARAIELLRQGMAGQVFLDAETRNRIYDSLLIDRRATMPAAFPSPVASPFARSLVSPPMPRPSTWTAACSRCTPAACSL